MRRRFRDGLVAVVAVVGMILLHVHAKVNPETLDQTSEGLSQGKPVNSEIPSESNSRTPEGPEIAFKSPDIPDGEDNVLTSPEIISGGSEENDTSSPEGPDIESRHPDTVSKGPEDSKVDDSISAGPESASRNYETTSKRPETTSTRPETTSTRPETTSTRPETTSTRPETTSTRPETTEHEAGPLNNQDTAPRNPDDAPDDYSSPAGDEGSLGVVVVALGGGEDLVVIAQIASVLHSHGHRVTALVYGPGPRDEVFPPGVKVLEMGKASDDPLYSGGVIKGVTPEEDGGVEWVSGRVVSSRVWACRRFSSEAWVQKTLSRASLVVTPLFLHDVCVLTLTQRLGVATVGVVTSRVGAWWVWEHLGALPALATTPVPPHTMKDTGIWARAANLARHYGYLSALRQQWQAPATTSLSSEWTPGAMDTLYASLAGVLLAWDPIVDPHYHHLPIVVPIGGFAFETGHMTKDVLVPALMNRAGVVTVCPGGGEAWVGPHALLALHAALVPTSYTVLWRAPYPHLRPKVSDQESNQGSARFIYKEVLPLSDVMNHPRHRLLVSTCGERDAMAAVYFGSPVLCLPVTSDQTMAAAALKDLGLAMVVPAADVTVPALREALITLAGDRSFRERGRELAEDLHDRPLAPPDRLLVTLERVMRRTRARRLVKKENGGLYLLQQANADVYLVLLILLTCFVALLIVLALTIMPILIKKEKAKAD